LLELLNATLCLPKVFKFGILNLYGESNVASQKLMEPADFKIKNI